MNYRFSAFYGKLVVSFSSKPFQDLVKKLNCITYFKLPKFTNFGVIIIIMQFQSIIDLYVIKFSLYVICFKKRLSMIELTLA